MSALLLSTSPLDSAADWRCPRCDFTLSADQMELGHQRLRSQVAALGVGESGAAEAFLAEAFLAEHLGPVGLLHATSTHVLHIKQGLLLAATYIPGCSPGKGI